MKNRSNVVAILGAVLLSASGSFGAGLITLRIPKAGAPISETNCRAARLAAARVPLFRGYFLDQGMTPADVDEVLLLSEGHAGEVCYSSSGDLLTSNASKIEQRLEAHFAKMQRTWGLPLDNIRAGFFGGLKAASDDIDAECKTDKTPSGSFVTPNNSLFEQNFNKLAFGSCSSSRLASMRGTAEMTREQRQGFDACIRQTATNAKRADCNDPRASSGDSPAPQTQGGSSGPPKQEKVFERHTKDGTETKVVTTMPDGSRREVVEKTDKFGKLIERTTSDFKSGASTPHEEWVQKGDGMTVAEYEAKAKEARNTGLEAKAREYEESAMKLKMISSFMLTLAGSTAAAGFPQIAAVEVAGAGAAGGLGIYSDYRAWQERQNKNKQCLYQGGGSSSRMMRYTLPTGSVEGGVGVSLVDEMRSCMCKTVGDARLARGVRGRCRSSEEETRLSCLRNPYDRLDRPRQECLDAMQKDAPNAAISDVCAVTKCPAANTVRSTVIGGKVKCECVATTGLAPVSLSTSLPRVDPRLVQCEDGKIWNCRPGGVCGCVDGTEGGL